MMGRKLKDLITNQHSLPRQLFYDSFEEFILKS